MGPCSGINFGPVLKALQQAWENKLEEDKARDERVKETTRSDDEIKITSLEAENAKLKVDLDSANVCLDANRREVSKLSEMIQPLIKAGGKLEQERDSLKRARDLEQDLRRKAEAELALVREWGRGQYSRAEAAEAELALVREWARGRCEYCSIEYPVDGTDCVCDDETGTCCNWTPAWAAKGE